MNTKQEYALRYLLAMEEKYYEFLTDNDLDIFKCVNVVEGQIEFINKKITIEIKNELKQFVKKKSMSFNPKKTLMNIRLRRESMHYSQEYVASKLKLTQNAYSKIECGLTEITLKRLGEISEIYWPSHLLC